MSQTVDSRVVEMRFDNKEFEANAKTTLDTLARLKQALENDIDGSAFDSLDRAARNVDLSGIQSGIEALTDRFSTMGIVGMTTIQNITNTLTHTLGNAVTKLFDTISSRGLTRAENIEKARFQLQGILGDASKVQTVMKNALDSVDGTAYALDEAARAASQLAASGVEAGDQMKSVLKGIAGVAATTSSDYEGISRIFTQIAGNGRVMGDQLLQLSNRGLNAAAELAKYFNAVAYEGKEASDAVKEQIAALTGASGILQDSTEAISEAAEASYDIAKKAADKEYKEKQKAYNKEYKALQKSLNEEYALKKAAYDKEYKALQESLNAEVQAVQEANSKRIEELQEKYQADVEAYREATEQKISLINEEYTESIKLIDEERYNKLKAVQDQIDAINEQAKAEQKALKDQANAEKKAELESILNNARNNKTKQQAAQVLADFEAELAREQLAEDRANQIEDLQNQKTKINEEAQEKKEEAQKKAQSAKEAVQTESNAELKAMQKAHQAELTQLRKEQNEQVEAMREANSTRLQLLRESQTEELSVYKEGQTNQLEAFREKQQEELELFKENQNELLESLKSTGGKASKYASQFGGTMAVTEADIRQMVSDGLISFDIFSEAMSSTFGDHAYEANKTFEGVMANIRAALAKTGALFYSPLIEQEGPLVEFLNAVRVKITEFNKALAPVAHYVAELINHILPLLQEKVEGLTFKAADFYHVWRGIYAIGEYLVSIFKAIGDGFKQALDVDAEPIKNSAREFRTFAESLKLTEKNSSNISKIAKAIIKSFKALFSIVKRLAKAFSPLLKVFGSTVDTVLDLEGGIADVIIRFADWLETSEKVQNFFNGLTKVMTTFANVIINVKNKIKDLTVNSDAFNVGKNFIQGFIEGVKSVVTTVYEYISSFCSLVLEKIRSIFGIESPSKETFQYGVYIIQGLINGIVSLVKNLYSTVTEVFTNLASTIKETFSKINWSELFTDGLEASKNFVTQFAENIRNGVTVATEAISDFFAGIANFIKSRKDGEDAGAGYGNGFIDGIKNFASNFWEKTKSFFQNVFNTIHNNFDANSIKEGLANGATYVVNFFKGIKDKLGEYLGTAAEWFKSFFSKIDSSGIATLATAAGAAVGGLILILKNLDIGSLLKLFKIIKPLVKIVNLLATNMDKITSSEKFQELMEKFHLEGLDTGLNYVAGFIEGLKEKIPDLLDKAKELGLKIIEEVKTILGIQSPSTVMYAIGGFVVAGLILGIVKNIGGLRDKITEVFGTVLDAIKEQFDKIKDDLPAISAVLLGVGTFAGVLMLARTLKKIVNPFQTLSTSLTDVKKALLGYQMDLKADALLKTAEAIAILAAVILTMYEVTKNDPDGGKLAIFAGGVFGAFLLLIGVLFLLTKITNKTKETSDAWFQAAKGLKSALGKWGIAKLLEGFGKAVLEVVIAFVMMTKTFDKYPDAAEKARNFMIAITATAAVFALLSTVLAKKTGEANTKVNNAASSFLYIAATLLTITNALQKLHELEINFDDDRDQLIVLGVLLVILTGIAVLLGKLTDKGKDNLSISASSIFAFCILLYATIGALQRILDLKFPKDAKPKLALFTVILLILTLLIGRVADASAEGKSLKGAGGALLGACAVILVTILAMKLLVDMPLMQILKGIGVVSVILLVIAGCLKLASGAGEGSFKSILGMLVLVGVIIASLGVFSKFDPKNLILSAASIMIALIGLAAVFYAISKIGYSESTGQAIIGMIFALLAIGGTLFAVARFDWKSLLAAGGAIAIALLAYAATFVILSKFKVEVKDVLKFLLGGLILGLIGYVLYYVSQQDWASILTAGIAIGVVVLAYAKAFEMMSKVKVETKDVLKFLLGTISLIIIGAALFIAARHDWKSLLAAGAMISVTILAYAEAFKLFAAAKVDMEDVKTFLLGSLATIIISVALLIAATQPWENLLAAGSMISVTLLAYAEAFKIFAKAEATTDDVQNFLLGVLGTIIISVALLIAANQPWDSLLGAGTAISETLLAYSAAMVIFGKANVKTDDIGNFLLGCIGVVAVGYIIGEAAKEDWKSLLAAGLSISVTLIAIAIAMVIATVAGTFKEGALAGIAVLDLFIADLTAVLAALGKLNQIPGFAELIKNGGELLVAIGTAIGNFVGSIIGGTLESISDSFPAIGTNLSKFMDEAQGFFDGLDQFDESKAKAAAQLVALILAFNVAEILNNIATITDVLNIFKPSLADKFESMGDALTRFAKKTEGINGYNVKNSAQAVEALVGVMGSIKSRDFRDAEDLPGYADNLAAFAEKMPTIVNNMADHDKETYENVASAMGTIIDVMDHVKSRDFRDAEDMPEFGERLATFAGYARSACRYGTDMSTDDAQNLYDCAEILIDIARLVPYQQNGESFFGRIFGDNDIGDFGQKVHEFAKYMGGSVDGEKSIQYFASSLNPAHFQNLYNSADWLLQIAELIPETKNGLGKLFSSNDMATFGLQARNLAMYMVGIQEYMNSNELKPDDFKNLKNAVQPLFDITQTIKDQTFIGDKNKFKPIDSLKNFGKALEDFGKNIKECGKKANDGYLGFSGAIELLQKLQEMMPDIESFTGESVTTFLQNLKQYGIDGLTNFLNSFTNSKEAVTKAISTMFGYISYEFTGNESKISLMKNMGRVTVGYLTAGMTESKQSIKDAANSIASEFRQTISRNNDFYQAGRDAGQGFANGIRDKIDEARQAGGSLGRAAYIAARKALDEHSPSKKMMEVGSYGGEGFVNGLLAWMKAAADTGEDLGYTATDSLKEALNNLDKEIQNEELINPVITPILDLSNVEDNASAINGLLNLDKPIALAANAGMSFTGGLNNLLSNIQASIPDNTNDDVVASINGLRDDLNILSTRVANLQVVMDSGELVGVLTDPIDQQLGFNAILNSRGVRQ